MLKLIADNYEKEINRRKNLAATIDNMGNGSIIS